MTTLTPLSHPLSVSIHPYPPTDTPVSLIVKSSQLCSDITFNTISPPSPSPFLTFKSNRLSIHHRKTLVSNTNKPLLNLETFTLGVKYLATDPISNAHVFHTESNGEETILTSTSHDNTEVKFKATKPSSSQPKTEIVELSSGSVVANIIKDNLGSSQYRLEIAGGVDGVVVCALVGLMISGGKNETSAQATGPGGGMA